MVSKLAQNSDTTALFAGDKTTDGVRYKNYVANYYRPR